ncbi:hypothetical protein OIDMADRAFT_45286 [Oidiodendron maius Zn]|uniref:Fe2OG dioxygenase domain-containing protein n=1 Tax=Oidiodendron maius (strain Zn) TaxID=913774 RepID=A0A0C3GVZ6_OIDMZ|nr:hypothetical protein OIDMADRAFT_45286 [Oidiodendron maius Zn]
MISKNLPPVDHFVPVQPSKENIPFVELRTIDLSRYNHGIETRRQLADEARLALTTQGFFTVINHGLSEEDITRQVDIGHTILTRTPHEEKVRLQASMRVKGGVRDQVENFNVYRKMTLREQPKALEPYRSEIQSFIDFTHKEIMFKLLRLLAIALEIPDEDYFVKLHDYDGHDETWLRYMEYYDAYNDDERKETGNVWLGGHQDFTSISLLFSQPMSTLQVRDYNDDSERKFVKHVPGGLIVNMGEIFLWWTGNYFKAAIHRVVEPPSDQRGHDRIVINTLLEKSPILREAGVEMAHLPENAPTSKQWSSGRISITGRNAVFKGKETQAVVEEKVGKVSTKWFQ